jgi:glycosyltransferase involved in cell wall biosynthesis
MKTDNKKKGVSVVICCYNSANRIKETLQVLAGQRFQASVFWEIILVDNASTDNTSEIARSTWNNLHTDIELRIVFEPKPGLGNARKKGIGETSCSFILFCDDDNWLDEHYVQRVYDILSSDPTIAACGGCGMPVFETQKPEWFDDYAEAFALGPQETNFENGKILNLYGAGLAINKHILDRLENSNFAPLMRGRVGNKLTSGEDTELTYAFVLMGYKLHYSPELKFRHYLPKERLNFSYLKKLFIAFGNDGPIRNLYYANISRRVFHRTIKNWNFHFILSLFRLIKYSIAPPKKLGRSVYFSWNKAYIKELLSLRKKYATIQANILNIKNIGSIATPEDHHRQQV